jgi:outer membrane protein assembly factor BamB
MQKYCLPALLICLLPAGLLADDWPQWRGPHRDGISQETGLLKEWPDEGPTLLWNSKKVNNNQGVGRGFSSVTVAAGKIYTLGDRGKDDLVFCLDEMSGKELWATRIAPRASDGSRCTPTVDGDRVYALSRQGILACLNTSDGKIVWSVVYKQDLGGRMMSGWDYSESPLVDGERLICTPGGDEAALAALNKYTGEVIWKSKVKDGGGAGYASIVTANVGGVKQYITWLGRCLVGVDASTGKLLWRYSRTHNGTANIPTSIVKDDLVFCTTAYGAGSALLQLVPNGDGGIEAKEVYFLPGNKLQNHHGGVILLGDYVYGGHGHNDGRPFCLNLKTGKFAWGPVRGVGEGSAAVAYADGNFYFRYQDGTMALIEATPEGFHGKSQFRLPSYTGTPSWPHPVIANGRLYIRGNDVLLCYDLRQK